MNTRYRNAFTEVYTILDYLEIEEYEKIPPEVLDVIEANSNTDYYYEIDEETDLRQQEMLPETKAILFNLFRDYLSTPEQKEKIIRMQKEERARNEQRKQQQYNVDLFANKKKIKEKDQKELLDLIEYKENIFTKIIKSIKNFMHRFIRK